ncbi:MAG: DUF815 domain-containing protein, partial [Nanoarchaeota archaeon]
FDLVYKANEKIDPFNQYSIFRVGNQAHNIEPVKIKNIEREWIIGQDKNVERLENLMTAFVAGNQIPFVALYGEPGVGKTLSMKYLANKLDFKLILIDSSWTSNLLKLAEFYGEKGYPTVIYIDDLHIHYDPRYFESFRTDVQGPVDFPKNVTTILSVNPEGFDTLPESIRDRFVIFDYTLQKPYSKDFVEKLVRANSAMLDIEFSPSLVELFLQRYNYTEKMNLNPRKVHQFLLEHKALGFMESK